MRSRRSATAAARYLSLRSARRCPVRDYEAAEESVMSISKSLADWVDERLGTREIGQALFGRKIPKAAGLVSWAYTLGSVVMFLFILQAVTGMFLAMNYAPTPENAYDSVRF